MYTGRLKSKERWNIKHIQRAETLRLRLRLALFKVRTNQTNLPLSQLAISNHDDRREYSATKRPLSAAGNASSPKLLPAPEIRSTACSAKRESPNDIVLSSSVTQRNIIEEVPAKAAGTLALPQAKERPSSQRHILADTLE